MGWWGSSFTSTAEKKDGEIADSLSGSVIDFEKKELHFNVLTGEKQELLNQAAAVRSR